jgi:hypothetical protein
MMNGELEEQMALGEGGGWEQELRAEGKERMANSLWQKQQTSLVKRVSCFQGMFNAQFLMIN